jgi:hypothetical protein
MIASLLLASSAGVAATVAAAAAIGLVFLGNGVSDLHEPLRDGRAHFADPGDADLHPTCLLWFSPRAAAALGGRWRR